MEKILTKILKYNVLPFKIEKKILEILEVYDIGKLSGCSVFDF